MYGRVGAFKFMNVNVWDCHMLSPILRPLSQPSMTVSNKYETLRPAGQPLHLPTAAENTLSTVQLCLSLSEVDCFCAVWNETLC
jgi:hypothetical protein